MITELSPGVRRILLPIQEFVRWESSSGVLLLVCTAVALAMANSPAAEAWDRFWHLHFAVGFPGAMLDLSLLHWINDGLMALFFLYVGLEIKRELLVGELSSVRKAALPVMAAVGGMVVPAGIFMLVAGGTPEARGWGIPVATDIAFALGVLTLLGSRVPATAKIFLVALAIADDLGAVAVIALFYTSTLDVAALGAAAAIFAALLVSSRLGIRILSWYCFLGLGLWLAVLHSGVHASIAGVLLAITIPAWSRGDVPRFHQGASEILDHVRHIDPDPTTILGNEHLLSLVDSLERSCVRMLPPLYRLEDALAPLVTYGVMPVFALANAGVAMGGGALMEPLGLGIIAGLVLGKPVGIVLGAWAAVRSGFASLPRGLTWRHVSGLGVLGGIGFTMSIFIATLALPEAKGLADAKTAVLVASGLAAAVGTAVLWGAAGSGEPVPE